MSLESHPSRRRRSLPAALTLGNLLCGVLAIGAVLSGAPAWQPAALVGLALLFDLFDGRAARALGAADAFGAELDSLADVVSFGVTPALALWQWQLHAAGWLGAVAAGAMISAAAVRLARFNAVAQRPKPVGETSGPATFTGLAVTIPAVIALSAVAAAPVVAPKLVALVALGLAGLMVSSFRYRSFKDRGVLVVLLPAAGLMVMGVVFTGQLVDGAALATCLGGLGYAASGPILGALRRATVPSCDTPKTSTT